MVITVIAREKCTLCNSATTSFYVFRGMHYYRCLGCRSILLDPNMHLSKEKEKERYEEHNNDVEDPRYQQFVAPIVDQVKRKFNQSHVGLDFGAGTGPVISKLLREAGFQVELYDPFFWNDTEKLNRKYDYIVCCEVIEHFNFPSKEFKLLRRLLKPNGSLLCMTETYCDKIDFGKWYYKNDPTHVFFYHDHALAWIKSHFGFSELKREGRLIHFEVRLSQEIIKK